MTLSADDLAVAQRALDYVARQNLADPGLTYDDVLDARIAIKIVLGSIKVEVSYEGQ